MAFFQVLEIINNLIKLYTDYTLQKFSQNQSSRKVFYTDLSILKKIFPESIIKLQSQIT